MGVLVQCHEGVATVTIERTAKRNALDRADMRRLADEFVALDDNPDVRVMVLTGADGNFCSGADLTAVSDDQHPLVAMEQINRTPLALHRMRMPTIAKVDGVAVGAGLNLALGCDLVVASDRARFSEIFSQRALSADYGGTWLLVRRIGLHRAKELCLLADIVSAAQASEIGLVNRVVPADELDATVDEMAARLATGPPIALALTKRMLDEAGSLDFQQALDREAQAQALNMAGADVPEAFAAFLAKRPPVFTGGHRRPTSGDDRR